MGMEQLSCAKDVARALNCGLAAGASLCMPRRFILRLTHRSNEPAHRHVHKAVPRLGTVPNHATSSILARRPSSFLQLPLILNVAESAPPPRRPFSPAPFPMKTYSCSEAETCCMRFPHWSRSAVCGKSSRCYELMKVTVDVSR
jgi:hypothetical protein